MNTTTYETRKQEVEAHVTFVKDMGWKFQTENTLMFITPGWDGYCIDEYGPEAPTKQWTFDRFADVIEFLHMYL